MTNSTKNDEGIEADDQPEEIDAEHGLADGDADPDGELGDDLPSSASSTVYVDLSTRLYHALEDHAGPDPAAFTRNQAERFSYRACPDCFNSGSGYV